MSVFAPVNLMKIGDYEHITSRFNVLGVICGKVTPC